MLPEERRMLIWEGLAQHRMLAVTELAQELKVAIATVRRDLAIPGTGRRAGGLAVAPMPKDTAS